MEGREKRKWEGEKKAGNKRIWKEIEGKRQVRDYFLTCLFVGSGLLPSVGVIPTQSPELESPEGLATLLWNNHRVVKDHPHAAITLSSTGLQSYMHQGASAGSMNLSTRKRGVTIKI